ncbi:unnamed protein product (macronuclear) [Paramecium tetraurelia]|uniref:B box-type domain-containing protein n=1 Tax=Paramecium tetraurelia TaxID=5888 RepID=A0DBC0_PARTE|nr:uncharacterized protein GSPATT00015231001 [Paramecium tetraurelia]CAK80337.1 unnamed protein product [Paramecium tetraurelia]|eukprot:XP_001447734.1 hypothetical protein (macronuclear) [Paramecium tetraurelia strain d4-2]
MKTKGDQNKGNTKQQPQKQINTYKEIQCYYHPNEKLKYFCKKPDCLQPLCKICLDIHIEEAHQESNDTKEVVSYEKCLAEVTKKMSDNLAYFLDQIGQLNNHIDRIINFQCPQNWMSLIQSSETQITDLIRSYFSNLKSYLFSISPEVSKLYSAQDRLIVCSKRVDQLRSELENLKSENSVTQLILFYQGDVEKLNNRYLQYLEQTFDELKQINFQSINAPKILINHNKLNDLMELLNQYINYEQEYEEQEKEEEPQIGYEEQRDRMTQNEQSEREEEQPIDIIMAQDKLSEKNEYGLQSNDEDLEY